MRCPKCGTNEGVHGGCDCGHLNAWTKLQEYISGTTRKVPSQRKWSHAVLIARRVRKMMEEQ